MYVPYVQKQNSFNCYYIKTRISNYPKLGMEVSTVESLIHEPRQKSWGEGGLRKTFWVGIKILKDWPKIKKCKFLARRRGLVVRVKIHVQEVVSSNPGPAVETIYHAPLIWIKSMKA